MKHLDLFSGIGGFALAAKWMGWQTVAFCEKDKYCQKLLEQNFPNIDIYGDIATIPRIGGIDIITGGFPCQPFSFAGHKRGKDDDRYLWPEMLRVIAQEKPAWVIGENVPGIIGMELNQVLFDLESQGYSVQSFVIPACAVNAWHRRDRVWILAHSNSHSKPSSPINAETCGVSEVASNAQSERTQGLRASGEQVSQAHDGKGVFKCSGQGYEQPNLQIKSGISRVIDGIPNRVDRVKGLGNAVVPQLVYEIYKLLKQYERQITLV